MGNMTDGQMLAEFVRSGSQQAFAELVQRHLPWVYSAALRIVRRADLADDVAQAVFIVLARKAPRLSSNVRLSGWLFRVTQFSSLQALRRQRRRERHERKAAAMAVAAAGPSAKQVATGEWEQIAPMLEGLVAKLSANDREALLLRYYQGKSTAEVGQELGISVEAAKKRVTRAVQRLREMFERRGITVSTATLSSGVFVDPAAISQTLAKMVTQAALDPASATESAVGIAKGATAAMARAKGKMAALIAMTLIAALVGLSMIVKAVIVARDSSGAPPVTTVAPDGATPGGQQQNTPPFAARLQNGIGVEILGITDGSANPANWWLPDGSPVEPTQLPVDPFPGMAARQPLTHRIAIRLSDLDVADVKIIQWAFDPDIPREVRFEDHKPRGIVIAKLSMTDPAKESITFGARFFSGAAQVVASMPGDQDGLTDSSSGLPVTFSAPIERNGTTFITVTHAVDTDWFQVGATLKTGESWVARSNEVSSQPNWLIPTSEPKEQRELRAEYFFLRIPRDRIDRFEFRRRPQGQWVQFRNLPLHPRAKTNVQILTNEY
jgi:RNA polymerase sigma factor (sigma-70 family)